MAIRTQSREGTVEDANSYSTVDAFRAYHVERMVDLSSYTDQQVEAALVKATDFLDARYSFVGQPLKADQGTACPRYLSSGEQRNQYLQDINTLEPSYLLTNAQWNALLKACVQLAYRALRQPKGLMPDPAFDATGQSVSKKTVKAGPVEKSVEYSGPSNPDAAVPSYPSVDLLIKKVGLTRSANSGNVSRA